MTLTEKIYKHVKTLPESAQIEVLDFVGYLESKNRKVKDEGVEWSNFSLSQAMQGIEAEPSPYSVDDILEII